MEHHPFIDDVPIETSVYEGFPVAMFDDPRGQKSMGKCALTFPTNGTPDAIQTDYDVGQIHQPVQIKTRPCILLSFPRLDYDLIDSSWSILVILILGLSIAEASQISGIKTHEIS